MATFHKGDHIVNTTQVGRIFCIVQSIREDGLLVVRNPQIGIWIADPTKCERFA